AYQLDGRTDKAMADLDRALSLDPQRDDTYAYRASARRQSGDAKGAMDDVETALALNGRNAEAHLERGHLRFAAGDFVGAREDFIQTALIAPGSPAADDAQAALEAMD
ncbi:tetratricopeptide repeat protein, partial [Salmonella enterica]|uniref:tetratricopeptide repeat protein n=1 Tax=Salmonella enterica TaxID=28901 RepID=UPI003D2E8615